MTADLTFPCERRFAATVREAAMAALRGAGVDEAAVVSAGTAIDRFLAEHVRESSAAPISAQVTSRALILCVAGRTLTVPF
jgi:hypothetical protein